MKTSSTEYTLEILSDARTMQNVFRWHGPTGRLFEVRVSQGGMMREQQESFSRQLYRHAHRLAEVEAEDSATPQEVAQRADAIMVELAGVINK